MSFHQRFSIKGKIILSSIIFSVILISVLFHFLAEDKLQFRLFSDKLFRSELEGNTLTLHYTLACPEKYGLDAKAQLPCYTGASKNDREEIIDSLSALAHISKDRLNEADSFTHDLLIRYLNQRLIGAEFDHYTEPFSPNSGIQSGLPILLADYTFRTKQDVEDYLAILDQTDEYLSGLLLYETEKAKVGLFMSDYSASKVISACNSIMDEEQLEKGTHFLHDTFEERIQNLTEEGCISRQEAQQYISENDRLLTTVMAPAYEQIADTFTLLKGTGTNNYGLYYFPSGRAYYEYLLASVTGSDRSVSEIKRLLFEDFQKNYSALLTLLERYPQIADEGLTASMDLNISDPAVILQDLKKNMSADFPVFPSNDENFQTNITVKSVSPSMEKYSSPAYYLTPPIDNVKNNIIYINKKNTTNNLTLYTTLAHEGYPGHLYQTVYSHLYLNQTGHASVRHLLHFGGFVEGWAYYVENLSYYYAEDKVRNNSYAMAYYEACRLNRNIHLCLYSLLDIAIHYDGATPLQVQKILQSIGISGSDSVTIIYQYITEEPVNYLKYYLGYMEIELLKEKAKLLWDKDFTLYRFHKFLLETGPSDFTGLNEQLLKEAS